MSKRIWAIVLGLLVFATIVTFILLDIFKEEGIFSGHAWWITTLAIITAVGLIWLVVKIIRNRKSEIPKEEVKRTGFYEDEEILESWYKDSRNKDPDMYRLEETYSFPSIENEKVRILKTTHGYNIPERHIFLAVDKKVIVDVQRDGTLEEFKEKLKPNLRSVEEETEEDRFGNRITKKLSKPIIEEEIRERLKKEREKLKDEQMQDELESPKKEEK